MRPFVLSEWVKDKSRLVVDKDGNQMTIVQAPMFLLEDGGIAGPYMAASPGHRFTVLCETPQSLYFAD